MVMKLYSLKFYNRGMVKNDINPYFLQQVNLSYFNSLRMDELSINCTYVYQNKVTIEGKDI